MPDDKKNNSSTNYQSTALSLNQLIGAPLHAMIEAESQAAQATASFIRNFGFESTGQQGSDDDFGQLRMATFQQEDIGPDGRPRSMRIDVPLLSLLPIPALQIKDAQLEFFVKIVDIQRAASKGVTSQHKDDLPDLQPIDFKAAMGQDPARARGRSSEVQMKVNINIQQADVPAGMARLFNLMERNISVREIEEKD